MECLGFGDDNLFACGLVFCNERKSFSFFSKPTDLFSTPSKTEMFRLLDLSSPSCKQASMACSRSALVFGGLVINFAAALSSVS